MRSAKPREAVSTAAIIFMLLVVLVLPAGCASPERSTPAPAASTAAEEPGAALSPPAGAATRPSTADTPSDSTGAETLDEPTAPAAAAVPSAPADSAPASPAAEQVQVVAVGYIHHGPMQPTVRAISDVLAAYGDAVNVTWLDLATGEGRDYCEQNGLTAHMNVLIDGRYEYQLDGKTVVFQWFEGDSWTAADLDAVIAGVVDGQ